MSDGGVVRCSTRQMGVWPLSCRGRGADSMLAVPLCSACLVTRGAQKQGYRSDTLVPRLSVADAACAQRQGCLLHCTHCCTAKGATPSAGRRTASPACANRPIQLTYIMDGQPMHCPLEWPKPSDRKRRRPSEHAPRMRHGVQGDVANRRYSWGSSAKLFAAAMTTGVQ